MSVPHQLLVVGLTVLALAVPSDGQGEPGLLCLPGAGRDCTSPGAVRWWHELDGADPQATLSFEPATAVAGGGLVIYQERDVVRAIDQNTGALRWKTLGVPNSLSQPPTLAYGDGLLVARDCYSPWKSSSACDFTVLDATSGATVSTFHFDGLIDVVAVIGGAVVTTADGLTAVDGRTGRRRWTDVPTYGPSRPAGAATSDTGQVIVGSTLCVLGADGVLSRLDLLSGARLPAITLNIPGGQRLAGYAAGVFVVDGRDQVRGLDATSGRLLWSVPPSSGSVPNVLGVDQAAGALVYLRVANGFEAVEATTGRARWTVRKILPFSEDAFVAARGSQLVEAIGESGTSLYGLDGATGALRWSTHAGRFLVFERFAMGDPPLVVAVVCNSSTASGCTNRRLVAYNW
jgi:outer membrane protein assembly factor BamB